jgi:hypothetical protein
VVFLSLVSQLPASLIDQVTRTFASRRYYSCVLCIVGVAFDAAFSKLSVLAFICTAGDCERAQRFLISFFFW